MNVFLPLKGRGGWEHIKLCISPFSLPTLRLVPSLSRPGGKTPMTKKPKQVEVSDETIRLMVGAEVRKTNQHLGQQLVMLPPTFEQKELRPFRSHQHVHLNFHSDVSFMLYSDCVGVRRAYPYKKYGYRGYMYMNIYTSSLFHGFCPYVGLSLLKQP